MQLYLIRHPEPLGARGTCYGRTDLGIEAGSLDRTVAAIRAQIPARVLRQADVFSSPATRCLKLARALAAPRKPVVAEDLWEMNFGSWEGKPWAEIPRDELDAWARDPWGYAPGGAESPSMVARRWRNWSAEVQSAATRAAIAVTHAGVTRVALASLNAAGAAAAAVPFGAVVRIDLAAPAACAAP